MNLNSLPPLFRRPLARALCCAAFAMTLGAARAHDGVSTLSALSALPIAVSVAATGLTLSAGATLVIVSAQVSADGAIWILERASDGARTTLRLGAQAAGGLSVAAGTVIVVTTLSTGCVLSAAGQAIAFIPNEIGSALLYNERVTR